LTGLLGGYYWVDWAHTPVQRSPSWVLFAVKWNLLSFVVIGLMTIAFLQGGRWFASICFLINLYFMVAMTFLSGMAVTGDWL
jgi:uncharacterized membrane protein